MQPTLFDRPEARPPSKLLRDPAMAAAIAKCLVARMEPATRLSRQAHPMECRWCKYPFGRLADALNDFNTWAGWESLNQPPGDPDAMLEPQVEAFMRLPYEEQIVLTARAAGYPDDTFQKNTGYEYPVGQGNVSGSSENVTGRGDTHGESLTDEQKGSSPGASAVEPQPVGGRDGAGNRARRGVGGAETAEGTQDRGVLAREAEAPGPGEGDSPIPIDRYRNPDGSDQSF